MEREILRLENIRKEFVLRGGGIVKAVNDVSLSVRAGETVAIVGESGCGKSTLAKVIAYMEQPNGGRLFFDGNEITTMRGKQLRAFRRQVQMIFQDPSGVFSPRMKIGTFLMEPWINFEKKSKKEARKEAIYALKRVELGDEYLNKYPHQLSGGELQRVSIARAIALHPKMLICDEATSALDVSIQEQILQLLKKHQIENNFTTLFICHDLAVAESFCDRVVVMYLGRIVEILEGKALRSHAVHPYSKALLASVFSVHGDARQKIKILPGEPPSPMDLPEGCAFRQRCPAAVEICGKKIPDLQPLDSIHQAACHLCTPKAKPSPSIRTEHRAN